MHPQQQRRGRPLADEDPFCSPLSRCTPSSQEGLVTRVPFLLVELAFWSSPWPRRAGSGLGWPVVGQAARTSIPGTIRPAAGPLRQPACHREASGLPPPRPELPLQPARPAAPAPSVEGDGRVGWWVCAGRQRSSLPNSWCHRALCQADETATGPEPSPVPGGFGRGHASASSRDRKHRSRAVEPGRETQAAEAETAGTAPARGTARGQPGCFLQGARML